MPKISELVSRIKTKEKLTKLSFRYQLMLSYTIAAVIFTVVIGIFFEYSNSKNMDTRMKEEVQALIEQIRIPLQNDTKSMLKALDSLYYNVIKNTDVNTDSVDKEFLLVCEANRDVIESIVLINETGDLIGTSSKAELNENIDIKKEKWFKKAISEPDSIHFFKPKLQNMFSNIEGKYKWVIPMSRGVWMNDNGKEVRGVLLINMDYRCIENIFHSTRFNNGYVYLVDENNEIIYHPLNQVVSSGIVPEANYDKISKITSSDGSYVLKIEGDNRVITIKTLEYTGWRIVGTRGDDSKTISSMKNRSFLIMVFMILIYIFIILNYYISKKIYQPIYQLEQSVKEIENGNLDTEITISGANEVRNLGLAIQRMAHVIKQLMKDIIQEHELKRKSELEALQSQINPHFLYNTLDIIVWMIEYGQDKEAVRIVSALAKLFRISLSKGKRVITLEDELEHVRNYMMIQQERYKNKFKYRIEVEDKVKERATIKLIIQPIVENSIYHGMEYMEGDGEILICAYEENNQLLISIKDNGPGISPEKVEQLMQGEKVETTKKGSGIGIGNVHERVQKQFGNAFGLTIQSEPDVGTMVTIRMPLINYKDWED